MSWPRTLNEQRRSIAADRRHVEQKTHTKQARRWYDRATKVLACIDSLSLELTEGQQNARRALLGAIDTKTTIRPLHVLALRDAVRAVVPDYDWDKEE